ncbi:hypothetical protein KI387_039764, partial [Taxus chinensis]
MGHLGQEDARTRKGEAAESKGSPFRAVRKNLSQTVWDSWNKWTRRTRTGRFGRNGELQHWDSWDKGT